MRWKDDEAAEERIGSRDLTYWPTLLGRWLVRLAGMLAKLVSANAVLFITAAVGGVIVVALTAISAQVYEAVDEGDGISGFDRPALNLAISLRTATNEQVVTWFTHLGGPIGMPILAGCVTVFLVLRWRSRTPLVLMLIAVAGSLAMTSVGKVLVGRVRPPAIDAVPPFESSPSFPSGHTLNSTVIAGLIAYLVIRRLESRLARVVTVVLAVGWAVAMGLSRVFLGHHWLTDVVFGWVLGLAWLGLVITSHRLYLTVRRSRHASARG